MEAGDYITSILTNSNVRSNCGIGFKGFGTMMQDLITSSSIAWILIYLKSSKKNVKRQSYQLEKVQVVYVKTINRYGVFSQDIQVSPFIIDAHSGVLGVGAIEAGEFTAVIGTSTCHLMLDSKQVPISSITGSVKMLLYLDYMPMKLVNQLSVICSNTQRTKHLNILWIKQMNIICLYLTI